MKRKHSRKTVIVDGAVQARIVLATSLPMFACLALALLGETLYRRLVEAGRFASDGTIFGMPEHRLGMLLLFVSAATVQVVVSLMMSQKVAGAEYHMRRILGEYRKGKHDAKIRLRKGDYQTQLADDLNSFFDFVNEGGPQSSASTEPPAAGPQKATTGDRPSRRKEPVPTEGGRS